MIIMFILYGLINRFKNEKFSETFKKGPKRCPLCQQLESLDKQPTELIAKEDLDDG